MIKNEAQKLIISIKKILEKNTNLLLSPIEEKAYNYEFDVKNINDDDKVKIKVFFGKKGVKTVLQGKKEGNVYKYIDELLNGKFLFPEGKNKNIPSEYIGTDESGKGDFFGPLVVAAFYVNKRISVKLQKLNVRDSKTLSENQIIEIANSLKQNFKEYFSIIILEPETYNKLYVKLGNNLNKLMSYAHSEAIKPLLTKFNVSFVITDKFSNRKLDIENMKDFESVTFFQETKAEKYPAVAAASILARAEVIAWFDKINVKLKAKNDLLIPKGASNEADKTAKYLAKKYGKSRLHRIMKLHFKNFSKIQ